ncbi:MAG TPA: rhomboid family intramembrane serine protease [Fimbriimonadaceae bacterium]|nr:rhomboid family intramembrane serine protease [Fimbriimonadaceae bacterium]
MLLPVRSKNPPESIPFATIGLILINFVVYGCTSNGLEVNESAVQRFAITGHSFDVVHIFTSMFLHADPFHILGNMFFLYLFGFAVEGRMKSVKFLILYLVSGAAGDALHHVIFAQFHPDIPSFGASGAIMGVLGAALYMFPHAKVTMFYGIGYLWWGTTDWAMWCVGLLYLGFDVLMALIGLADGVGHYAHIGGAVAGFAIAAALRVKRDSKDASGAKATLSETKEYQTLTRLELESLHRLQPENTEIVVNWVYRSMRDPAGVRQNCIDAFVRLFPKIVREEEPGPVAVCLLSLNLPSNAVPSRYVGELAGRLERSGDNVTALRLYDLILADPSAAPADAESAIFRVAMLSESAMGNYARAQICYREILAKYPMGPFAEQARTRLDYVTRRLAATP